MCKIVQMQVPWKQNMHAGDLKFLATLAETRTFTAAARRLDTSHTTVARKLRQMESYFGARLAERVGDGIVLTAAGEEALRSAGRISEEMADLERRIAGRDASLSGQIVLTSVDILVWHFMPVLSGFRGLYPEIELTIQTNTEVVSLSRRDAEVALRLTNDPEGYLFGQEVGRFDFALYGHEDLNPLATPMEQLPWLEYGTRDCRERSAKWKKHHAPAAVCKAFLPTPLMMLSAVKAGLGIGALPMEIAARETGLIRLSAEPCFSLGIWLLTPEELRRTARVRALYDCFRAERASRQGDLDLTGPGV
jgi:DNA-binding transcriptional LysR family regulator